MKIAFICKLPNKKLEQKLLPLSSLNEVEIIDLFRSRPWTSKEEQKIRWRKLPAVLRSNTFFFEISRLIQILLNGWKYDIIIGCHQTWHGVCAWFAGKIWRKPVIQIIIGDIYRAKTHFLAWHAIMDSSACAVRGHISEKLLKENGYKHRIVILHNAFELPQLPSAPIEKKFDLIAVGDYAPSKDYPWMFEIIAGLKEQNPNVKLAVIGQDHDKYSQPLIKKLKLENNVFLLGPRFGKELEDLILSSKALLLTSSTEGLPMVLIEAMSLGIPIFATSVGEIPWLLEGKLSEHMLIHGNTKSAVQKIGYWLNGKQTVPPIMFRNRIEQIAQLFTKEAIADQWRQLIFSALKKTQKI